MKPCNLMKRNVKKQDFFKITWSSRTEARSATFCWKEFAFYLFPSFIEMERLVKLHNVWCFTWVILLGGTLQGQECFPPGRRKKSNWQHTCHFTLLKIFQIFFFRIHISIDRYVLLKIFQIFFSKIHINIDLYVYLKPTESLVFMQLQLTSYKTHILNWNTPKILH